MIKKSFYSGIKKYFPQKEKIFYIHTEGKLLPSKKTSSYNGMEKHSFTAVNQNKGRYQPAFYISLSIIANHFSAL